MNPLIIIAFALLLTSFFSAMELAFFAADKLRLELDRKQGHKGSGIINVFTRNPGQFNVAMITGVNIVTVIFSILSASFIERTMTGLVSSAGVILLIQITIIALVVILFADFIPRYFARQNPNILLRFFALPAATFYYLFLPFSKFSLWMSNLLIRMFFGLKTLVKEQENRIFTRVDLDHFVDDMVATEDEREEENDSLRIFQNALDFSFIKARECMVPRTEIDALPLDCSAGELRNKFIESGHSKILLFRENIDNMAGYYELKDILREPVEIESRMRKLPVVPETMTASKVLRLLTEEKKSIALVVDEFGGTAGVITIEDVLEKIVGDIEDEHDTSDLVENRLNEKEFIFSGRLDIDYLNEEYNLDLPESDEYTTLAGLILYVHGNIPKQKDNIRVGHHLFTVLRSSSTKVELLKLKSDHD
ncbi:MAG: hemolysin family protein [Bacteroidales bacterium]|nr:hemolysin family protein [Bacteroidales bacterium]